MKLEFDGIQYGFAHNLLLTSVYVTCEKGKITGLLGRNGSGKSTLLKIVFGALSADVASIRINGTIVKSPAYTSRHISYLPQTNFIPPGLSLRKIMKLYNTNEVDIFDAFPELQTQRDMSLRELSGGFARLFEVILILNSRSTFCLLDEPFTGLAPAIVERLHVYLQRVKVFKGILITDHRHRQVRSLADTLYLLTNGKTYPIRNDSDLIDRGYLAPL